MSTPPFRWNVYGIAMTVNEIAEMLGTNRDPEKIELRPTVHNYHAAR
jgi:hypothetical protein